jgi:hypothetical protein
VKGKFRDNGKEANNIENELLDAANVSGFQE